MSTFVIKGRGANRGKYLHWLRPSRGAGLRVLWTRKQSAATRFGRHPEANREARDLGGYVVRLVAPKDIGARLPELRAVIRERAAEASEALDCHWVSGDDEAPDYCLACCEKEVARVRADRVAAGEDAEEVEDEIRVGGGYRTDHDSPPHCCECGAKLDGSLTDYGSDEEIDAYIGKDRRLLTSPDDWEALETALENLFDNDPRWRAIAKVVDAASAAQPAKAGAA